LPCIPLLLLPVISAELRAPSHPFLGSDQAIRSTPFPLYRSDPFTIQPKE